MQFSGYSLCAFIGFVCVISPNCGADQELATREKQDLAYAKSALVQLFIDYPDLDGDATLGPQFREWFVSRIAGKSDRKSERTSRVVFIPTEPFNGETSMVFVANGPIPTVVLLSRDKRKSGYEKWVLICLELERSDLSDVWNGLMEKVMTTEMTEAEFISNGLEYDYHSLIAAKKRIRMLDLRSRTQGNQNAETQIDRIPDTLKEFLEGVGRGEYGEFNRKRFFQAQYRGIRQNRQNRS